MAIGYTRQAAANISAGLTIASADLNAEFNQAQSAFDITTGHDHSGSSAGTGAKIILTTAVSGVLPVLNGGTGVTTSTGSGSNVLSITPTFLGTITAANITASGTLTLTGATPLIISGASTAGYGSVTVFRNTSGGATDPDKYLRVNPTGALEIINSAFTLVRFIFKDSGILQLVAYGAGALSTDIFGNVAAGTLAIANGGTGSTSTTFCNLTTNVTGTLPVANGGTGVTTSTGSGNNVLSASPTFTGTLTAAIITAATSIGAPAVVGTSTVDAVTYLLSGASFATSDATHHSILDKSANTAILLGGAGDPKNYYRNTTHTFGSIAGATSYFTADSAGLLVYATNVLKYQVYDSGTISYVNAGFGSQVPNHQVHLSLDDGFKPNGGNWGNSSDARIKQNIEYEFDALDKINALKPALFEWINPEVHGGLSKTGGFIAQDMLEVFPEYITESPPDEEDKELVKDGKLLNLTLHNSFFGYLVKAIQELDKKIENK